MSGWRPRAAASVATGAICARSARRSGAVGKTSGVIPFIRVMDSLTLAICQGSLRRGSAAVYLPVSHPEIEEFVEIRRPTGGDPNRKALNLHHGIQIPDAFMRAVEADEHWALRSPKDQSVVREISARSLWIRILTARIETGEPYLMFSDHVEQARPEHHKLAGLEVKTSNLCSEITLPTGRDHHGKRAHGGVLPVVAEPGKLVRVGEPSDVHRGRDAVPRQCVAGLHRPRAAGHGEGAILGDARTLGRAWRDGVPFVPAGAERAVGKRGREGLEQAHLQAHPRAGGRRLAVLAEERGACPDAEEYGMQGTFLAQNVDRADRVDLDHRRQCLAGDRADRGERVPAKDAVRQFHRAQPASAETAGGEGSG